MDVFLMSYYSTRERRLVPRRVPTLKMSFGASRVLLVASKTLWWMSPMTPRPSYLSEMSPRVETVVFWSKVGWKRASATLRMDPLFSTFKRSKQSSVGSGSVSRGWAVSARSNPSFCRVFGRDILFANVVFSVEKGGKTIAFLDPNCKGWAPAVKRRYFFRVSFLSL